MTGYAPTSTCRKCGQSINDLGLPCPNCGFNFLNPDQALNSELEAKAAAFSIPYTKAWALFVFATLISTFILGTLIGSALTLVFGLSTDSPSAALVHKFAGLLIFCVSSYLSFRLITEKVILFSILKQSK
jgi:hypothetical protein